MSKRYLSRSFFPASVMLALAFGGEALAQSGGLFLPEEGGPLNATAQAGSAAIARDAQTARTNPAGMTRLEGTQIMLTAQPFRLEMDFNLDPATTATGGSGGDQGDWFPAGAVYLATPIDDNAWFGLSMTAPVGLGLDPDSDWAGRYYVTEVQLAVLNISPSLGIRINDQWSIGGAVDFQYALFEQDMAINLPGPVPDGEANIDGDSWELGFSLSLMWEPSEKTRIGARWHSEVEHELEGDFTARAGSADVSTDLTIPQSITISGYHELNEQWAVMADVGWTQWSTFDRTIISIDGGVGTQIEIPRDFDDVWNVSVGAHYQMNEDWLLMFGVGYTSSPVDDEKRTPDMPVDEQFRAAFGLEYQLNDHWTVGANYTFAWLGDNEIDQTFNPSTGRLKGDYDAFIHIIGLYASIRF